MSNTGKHRKLCGNNGKRNCTPTITPVKTLFIVIWTQLSDNDRIIDGPVEALLTGATNDARKFKDLHGLDEEVMIGIQPYDEIEGSFEVYVQR